jgi:hypothetical protein
MTQLQAASERVGLHVETYSPGDGVTRYRFFVLADMPVSQDYFGPTNGVHTALGIRQAESFVRSVTTARFLSGRQS